MTWQSRNLTMLGSAFVVALVLAGCVRKRPALPDAPDPAPEVAEVRQPQDARFGSPALKERFRRLRAAADEQVRPDWKTTPFARSSKPAIHGTYRATWSNSLDVDGGMPLLYDGPKEVRCCSLEAYFDADRPVDGSPLFVGLRFEALYKPARQGWGARLDYRTFDGKPAPRPGGADEDFCCYLTHYPMSANAGRPNSQILVHPGGMANYSEWFRFGNNSPLTRYQFTANVQPDKGAPRPGNTVPDAEVRAIFASPEAFRDYLVAAFTKLLQQVEEEVKSGKPLHGVIDVPLRPHEPRKQPPPHQLTPDEQRHVLETARKEVTGRIDVVREHYEAMYAAAQKAFSLRDCLLE